MRTTLWIAGAMLAFSGAAGAQMSGKITGKAKCAKPDPSYSIPVNDTTGHSLGLATSKCTWSAGTIGTDRLQTHDHTFTSDMMSSMAHERGYGVGTTANGDKYYVKFEGTSTIVNHAPSSSTCTWAFTGGTGKLKGLTGKGTCKGTYAPDGTVTFDVTGDYMIPKMP